MGALYLTTAGARAWDDSKYPNFSGQWRPIEDIDKGHAFTEMQDPGLIYVMSTSVLRAARKHTAKIPIVFSNCSWYQAEQLVKDHLPSRPEEFHLESLTEPDLGLSTYPARATQ